MPKIILLDFDDTFETEMNGQVIYNEPLIEALKQAKSEGAYIIGFTNWHSGNYALKTAVGRNELMQGLFERGLALDSMNITWNFLHVYQLIMARKSTAQTCQDYIDSLTFESRLELLGDYFYSVVSPLECVGSNTYEAVKATETELKEISIAAMQDLGLGSSLPDTAEFKGGKEEMYLVLLRVLGLEHEYITFDDKVSVANVGRALATRDNANIHNFIVMRLKEMKARNKPQGIQEAYSYQEAIQQPSVAAKKLVQVKTIQKQVKSLVATLDNALDSLKHNSRFNILSFTEFAKKCKSTIITLNALKESLKLVESKGGTASIDAVNRVLGCVLDKKADINEVLIGKKISLNLETFIDKVANNLCLLKQAQPSMACVPAITATC